MKNYFLPLLSLLLLSACIRQPSPAECTLTVSIEPIRYLTEQIAGQRARVNTLVPRGSNPETYEPTPQQLVDLANSRAYLRVGELGFERTRIRQLTENAPQVQVFDLSRDIPLLRSEDHSGTDPHIWTSPQNARLIAANIYEALCRIDTAGISYYRERLARLQQRIDSVDQAVQHLTEPIRNRSFLIYHPALGYFARDYGLRQIPIEEEGKELTGARLKALIQRCRAENIRVLFVQQEFSEENARAVARETGARMVRINPLSYHWVDETLHIANSLRDEHE